jgi:hypothetical protein
MLSFNYGEVRMGQNSLAWGRLTIGATLDETAKSAVQKLTTPAAGENRSPGIAVSGIDDYTLKVEGHRMVLIAEYRRAVDESTRGSKSLVGLIEFRRLRGDVPEGGPVHTMWFDSEGRLSVSGQPDDAVDYVLGNHGDYHLDARNAFLEQMAVVLDRLLPRIGTSAS